MLYPLSYSRTREQYFLWEYRSGHLVTLCSSQNLGERCYHFFSQVDAKKPSAKAGGFFYGQPILIVSNFNCAQRDSKSNLIPFQLPL